MKIKSKTQQCIKGRREMGGLFGLIQICTHFTT